MLNARTMKQWTARGPTGAAAKSGNPNPNEKGEDVPNHRQHKSELERVVKGMGKPRFGRVRRVVAGEDDEDRPDAERENDETMDSERIAGGRRKERQPTKGDRGADDDGELPLSPRKLRDHITFAVVVCRLEARADLGPPSGYPFHMLDPL